MKLYEGTVSARDDTYRVKTNMATFELPKRLVNETIDIGKVLIGFRPQDLYQTRNRDLEGPVLDTDVRVVEPVGTEAIVHSEANSDDITAKVGDFHLLSADESLSLMVGPRARLPVRFSD